MSGSVAVPTVTTVSLATASRHELVTLLASKSPFVRTQQKAEIAHPAKSKPAAAGPVIVKPTSFCGMPAAFCASSAGFPTKSPFFIFTSH